MKSKCLAANKGIVINSVPLHTPHRFFSIIFIFHFLVPFDLEDQKKQLEKEKVVQTGEVSRKQFVTEEESTPASFSCKLVFFSPCANSLLNFL